MPPMIWRASSTVCQAASTPNHFAIATSSFASSHIPASSSRPARVLSNAAAARGAVDEVGSLSAVQEAFLAVDDIAVAGATGRRLDAGQVGAGAGLSER